MQAFAPRGSQALVPSRKSSGHAAVSKAVALEVLPVQEGLPQRTMTLAEEVGITGLSNVVKLVKHSDFFDLSYERSGKKS